LSFCKSEQFCTDAIDGLLRPRRERPGDRRTTGIGSANHIFGASFAMMEGATDDFAQRLGAVDDEQPADLGIKPAHG
jgi:hypothetical protein